VASQNPKPGRNLVPEVLYTVGRLYCTDSVSRVKPGRTTMWQLNWGTDGTEIKQVVRSIFWM
jgi:hypothetical protein